MTNEEVAELIVKSKSDGAQLFTVVSALYKLSLVFIAIIGSLGFVSLSYLLGNGYSLPALGVAMVTITVCLGGYALAVLGCNGAKVMVHALFANLAILEKMREK